MFNAFNDHNIEKINDKYISYLRINKQRIATEKQLALITLKSII